MLFIFSIFSSLLLSVFYCPAPCPFRVSVDCLYVCMTITFKEEEEEEEEEKQQQQCDRYFLRGAPYNMYRAAAAVSHSSRNTNIVLCLKTTCSTLMNSNSKETVSFFPWLSLRCHPSIHSFIHSVLQSEEDQDNTFTISSHTVTTYFTNQSSSSAAALARQPSIIMAKQNKIKINFIDLKRLKATIGA